MANIPKVIAELQRHKLTEPVPDGHPVASHARRWASDGADRPGLRLGPWVHAEGGDVVDEDGVSDDAVEAHDGSASGWPDGFLLGVDPDAELDDLPVADDIPEAVAEEGIDALAWYRSFHWEPAEQWGISIRESAVYYLAREVFGHPSASCATTRTRGSPCITSRRSR